MKLSTRARYGVRALLELTLNQGNGPMLMSEIAENQAISRKYLHAILSRLKAAGFVRSVRGSGGGYVLAKNPEDVYLKDVLEVLEGSLSLVDCVDSPGICKQIGKCATHDLWEDMSQALEKELNGRTLQELAQRQRDLQDSPQMYYI